MRYWKAAIIILLSSPIANACFDNSGCPKGNVCVRTGQLMGICVSQAQPFIYNTQRPMTGPSYQPSANTNTPATGVTKVTTPGGNQANPATPMTGGAGGVGVSPNRTTTIPSVPPAINNPVRRGICTDNSSCEPGFVCSRPSGIYHGLCTKISD